MQDLTPLSRILRQTRARMRAQRALEGFAYALAAGFAVSALYRGVGRLLGRTDELALPWLLVASAGGGLFAALWPLSRARAASRLDHAHGLSDRLRSALEFMTTPEGQRTPFMQASIRDALRHCAGLSAAKAAPFARPYALPHVVVLAGLWALTALVPLPAPRVVTPEPASVKPLALSAAETSAFREQLEQLSAASVDEELPEEARAYNALLDSLSRGEASREEAIEALLSLEKRLVSGPTLDRRADDAAFAELAKDLAPADDALRSALLSNDAPAAAAALDRLARRMEGQPKRERALLKRSLDQVLARERARAAAEAKERELSLLTKRSPDAEPRTPAEKRLLQQQKRELERLRRENQERAKQSRELARLSRELSSAAEALGGGAQDQAAEQLSRAAESLRRFARERMTEQQRQDLQRQMSLLRELMQRQQQKGEGQGGEGSRRDEQRRRFDLRAQGRQEPERARLVLGKLGEAGERGEGSGDAQKEGSGADEKRGGRSTKDGDGARVLRLDGAGEPNAELLLPGVERRVTESEGGSSEHDPKKLARPTDIDEKLRDSQVHGSPSKGPTRSEVILDAADRGFATTSYRNVYTEYRSHAEEVLERDEIPPGYRFYVERYFQLIRPRRAEESP
jgi:hypothetical protein